jgi:hypothetical protein
MKQHELDSWAEQWHQVECELGKLSSTLNEKTFCKRLIGSVDVAMVHHGDIDEAIEKHKEWSVKEISRLQIRLW